MDKEFIMSHYFYDKIDFFLFFLLNFLLFWGKGREWKQKDGEINGIEIHDVKNKKEK